MIFPFVSVSAACSQTLGLLFSLISVSTRCQMCLLVCMDIGDKAGLCTGDSGCRMEGGVSNTQL